MLTNPLPVMAKFLFFSIAHLILLHLFVNAISPAQAVSCTMCDSCANPCLPPASPPPPPPPPPSIAACPPPPNSATYYNPPPPPNSATYYNPPPPPSGGNSYFYPPPPIGGSSGNSYPTPPPPNPILPYFPFYFYNPPPPEKAQACSRCWIMGLPSVFLFFVFWIVI